MVTFNTSKRVLFNRIINRNPEYIRPPWAIDEYDFVDICRNCKACLEVCPESIIELDSRNQPIINFQKGECTFCSDCVSVCESGALSKLSNQALPWYAKVELSEGCLAVKDILCRSCGEVCEHRAIHFPLTAKGIVSPEINREKCNGCGACIAICPTQALIVRCPN